MRRATRAPAARGAGGVLLVMAALAACDAKPLERAAPATSKPLPTPAAASGQPRRSPSGHPPEAQVTDIEILRLTLTSGVRDKEPVDALTAVAPGQRVWVHLAVRNRTPAKRGIALVFRVDGDVRSTVDLDVERSWSYRTWAYNTLKPDDGGELEVDVVNEREQIIAEARLPIRRGASSGVAVPNSKEPSKGSSTRGSPAHLTK